MTHDFNKPNLLTLIDNSHFHSVKIHSLHVSVAKTQDKWKL